LLRPILFRLPPETVHELALNSLPFVLGPGVARNFVAKRLNRSPFGPLQRFGLTFANPVGLAAGFDKDGVALKALGALGFGFIEAGTVTYQPQPGNPRPRLFRLPLDKGLINRAGFNNDGAAAFVERVKRDRPNCVLGVSIGKSKAVPMEEAVADYLKCFELVHSVADYIAVNVSSPNTPGLRDLQRAEQLETLLRALQERNTELATTSLPALQRQAGMPALQRHQRTVPLLVKLAPDLDFAELELIVDVIKRTNIAGIIATNTTVGREGLRTPQDQVESFGPGGLSGAPLRRRSTGIIATLYRLTRGTIPLIGVGGIFTAEDAWEKICAGAGLVQLYTGFIYQGPSVAREINEGLAEILQREGFASLDEAVGSKASALTFAGHA
jgi:dihydroorotate dehydrogenase